MRVLDQNWRPLGHIVRGIVESIEAKNALIAEYRAYGLDPVYADEERTIVCSLPMMLHMGWRIEEIGGRKALARGTA